MLQCFYISLSHSIRHTRHAARTRILCFLSLFLSFHHTDNRHSHNHACTLCLGGVNFCRWLSDIFHTLYHFTNLCMLQSVLPLEDYNQTKQMMSNCFTSLKSGFPVEFTLSTRYQQTDPRQVHLSKLLPLRTSQTDATQPPPSLQLMPFPFLFFLLQTDLLILDHAIHSQLGDLNV